MNDLLPLFEEQRVGVSTWPDRPRALLSYAYASKVTAEMFAEWGDVDIIIDSGAFTAHNSGKPIDHAAYLEWLGEHAHLIGFAFALDVIGDPLATLDNYRHGMDVLAGAVQLVPTWHIGTSFDVLERYCAEADYVAVGGAVPHYQKQNDLYRLSLRAHEIARANGTRLHGLGMTGRRVMFGLPWASVDSSSWSIPARMPFLYLANEDGRMVSLNYGRPMPEYHRELVRQYGGDPTGMDVEGYALTSVAGKELAAERKLWGTTASARAYMVVEAAKRRATGHDFHVYLASIPRDVDTILTAHAAGDPWHDVPATTERTTTTDPHDVDDDVFDLERARWDDDQAEPLDVVDRAALTEWATDRGFDPDDPETSELWADDLVGRAEDAADDAAWARGCG